MQVHNNGKKKIHTSQILSNTKGAIVSFTGPTSLTESDFPNNGFFCQGKILHEFGKAATRKGAILILNSGKCVLVDDILKWQFISDNFKGVDSLIGTSFYFTDKDDAQNEEIVKYRGRSKLSYLMQYTTKEGKTRTVFILASMATREMIKKYIDLYVKSQAGSTYIAVELEKDQADCFIKTKNGNIQSLDNQGFYNKPDHYVVVTS